MKNVLTIVIVLLVLVSCGKAQNSISDYESNKVKFAKTIFTSNNNEFTISLPKEWQVNEDPVHSDTLLYVLETGDPGKDFVVFVVYKMNVISGSIDTEFDHMIKRMTDTYYNVHLIEKSEININQVPVHAVLLRHELDNGPAQDEIDIFYPISENQYYYFGMISDINESTLDNMSMMIECAKSFRLKK